MTWSGRRMEGWRGACAALAVLVAAGGTQLTGQAPTGAAGRPPVATPEAPLLVLSPKAKSPGWTGVHRPHTKLADVLARHRGQADWAETIHLWTKFNLVLWQLLFVERSTAGLDLPLPAGAARLRR